MNHGDSHSAISVQVAPGVEESSKLERAAAAPLDAIVVGSQMQAYLAVDKHACQ